VNILVCVKCTYCEIWTIKTIIIILRFYCFLLCVYLSPVRVMGRVPWIKYDFMLFYFIKYVHDAYTEHSLKPHCCTPFKLFVKSLCFLFVQSLFVHLSASAYGGQWLAAVIQLRRLWPRVTATTSIHSGGIFVPPTIPPSGTAPVDSLTIPRLQWQRRRRRSAVQKGRPVNFKGWGPRGSDRRPPPSRTAWKGWRWQHAERRTAALTRK